MKYELTIETDDIGDVQILAGLIALVESRSGSNHDIPNQQLEAFKELLIHIDSILLDTPREIAKQTFISNSELITWQAISQIMHRIETKLNSAAEYNHAQNPAPRHPN